MPRTAGCQEAESLMQALADGALAAKERATLEAHLPDCPDCTAEAARLRDNAVFLQEVLSPLRLAPEFATDFLFKLPKKDPKRKAAPAAPRTMVIGASAPRRSGPLRWVLGLSLLGGAGLLAWAFFGREGETFHREPQRPTPEVKPRPEKGQGAADPKSGPGAGTLHPAGGPKVVPPQPPRGAPPATSPFRSAVDLLAALRAVRGDAYGAAIQRGWDLLAGSPAEAKAARELASKEKDPRVRAALVLCLGADGGEEARAAARSFLGDEAPEVRTAAALAVARALSIDAPAGKVLVPSGSVLGISVPIGPLADDPGRGELLARLSAEADLETRRTLVLSLGPTAASDIGVRDHLLDGVKGAYGDDLRATCLAAVRDVRDPAAVAAFAAALDQPGTAKALQPALVDAMVAADARAAADLFAEILPRAESPDLRCKMVVACANAGGAAAQKTLLSTLATDQEGKVRLAAVALLRKFPSREVLEAVQKAAGGDGHGPGEDPPGQGGGRPRQPPAGRQPAAGPRAKPGGRRELGRGAYFRRLAAGVAAGTGCVASSGARLAGTTVLGRMRVIIRETFFSQTTLMQSAM